MFDKAPELNAPGTIKMKIIQYTVNIGDYDKERNDILCFTEIDVFKNNGRNSRLPKILSHLYLDCDISVYWDANKRLRPEFNIEKFINEDFDGFDIVAQKSTLGRDCVYQEIEAAKKRVSYPEEIKLLDKQAKYYRSIGVPEHIGTLAGYQPLIRRHNEKIKRLNEVWWAIMSKYSYRDQCSFPVALMQCPDVKVLWVNNQHEMATRDYRHKYFPKIS